MTLYNSACHLWLGGVVRQNKSKQRSLQSLHALQHDWSKYRRTRVLIGHRYNLQRTSHFSSMASSYNFGDLAQPPSSSAVRLPMRLLELSAALV